MPWRKRVRVDAQASFQMVPLGIQAGLHAHVLLEIIEEVVQGKSAQEKVYTMEIAGQNS